MSSTVLLDVRRLNKRFGGVVATDQVDLQIAQGEIHALIGPNGAGKTTLVAQLAGQVPSDSGSVHFDGADITHMATHLRAHRGLVRSFQITRLFKSMSVLDNVALAIQASLGQVFSAWRPVKQDVESHDRAMAILERLGLADKHYWLIEQLSHGEQRALEVGMALAGKPKLVLLDEPLAGMGLQESEAMTQLIDSLRRDFSVLLIEHDVEAVFRLADTVSVLVSGRIVASGKPADVRANPAVTAAYLGAAQ
jgi:branched-chain amino acid transport system ATP-binding protein